MELIIIDGSALSLIDMSNLKEFNREHHPVTVVVVESNGYSKRFKLQQSTAEGFVSDISSKYIMIRWIINLLIGAVVIASKYRGKNR